MKLFKNRIFDPNGLMIVLSNILVPILIIGLLISMMCFPTFWAIGGIISLIVGAILAIVYGIWKAFNLIFPKRD